MLTQMVEIFTRVLLPVLVMVGLGAILQRYKPLSVETLVRLNLYLFVPAFLFVRVADSTLTWWQIGGIAIAVLGPMALLGMPVYVAMRSARAPGPAIAAVTVGGLFYNAGNFGIPVAELAFGDAGGSVQALVVVFANTAVFFVGYVILALAQGRGARAALGYFRLPMIYVIVAALLVRDTRTAVPSWLNEALRTVAAGMVPIALVTLGAQLAQRARWPNWRLIAPVLIVKLLALPAVTAAVVWGLGLWPWPGAQLVLAAAAPTAVNTLLLTLELEGDADTAADSVFWTTISSAATVTVVLSLILHYGGTPPP
jgi:malate permease and related proteins